MEPIIQQSALNAGPGGLRCQQILYVYANNIQQGSSEAGGDILVSPALGLRVTTLAACIGNSGTNSMGVIDLIMGQSQQQAKRHQSGLFISSPVTHPPIRPSHRPLSFCICMCFFLPSALFSPFTINTAFCFLPPSLLFNEMPELSKLGVLCRVLRTGHSEPGSSVGAVFFSLCF